MTTINYTRLIADKETDGSIRHWFNNDKIPAIAIVYKVETFLYSRLRMREMLTRATGTIASAADSLAAPARLVYPRQLMITGSEKAEIEKQTPEDLSRWIAYDAAGAKQTKKPQWYSVEDVLLFDSKADQSYPYNLLYYQQLAPLDSGSNATNFLITKCFTAFHYAAMSYGYDFLKMKDDAERFLQRAQGECDLFNSNDEESMRGAEMALEVR